MFFSIEVRVKTRVHPNQWQSYSPPKQREHLPSQNGYETKSQGKKVVPQISLGDDLKHQLFLDKQSHHKLIFREVSHKAETCTQRNGNPQKRDHLHSQNGCETASQGQVGATTYPKMGVRQHQRGKWVKLHIPKWVGIEKHHLMMKNHNYCLIFREDRQQAAATHPNDSFLRTPT